MTEKQKTIVVTGPTATGKTSLGVALARAFNGEVISVDSRQVFRGMDIGTGKDLSDFGEGKSFVPYHLMDVVDPNDDFNLVSFCELAEQSFSEICGRGNLPLFVGGTAMYLDAILKGYQLPGGAADEELRKELREKSVEEVAALLKEKHPQVYAEIKDKQNKNRLLRGFEKEMSGGKEVKQLADFMDSLILGVFYHRKEVHKRIEMRLDARIDEGMIDEVQSLYDSGVSWDRLDYFGLEYRYVSMHLKGLLTKQQMRDQLLIKIRQFAKRQDIWFRKMEREGMDIHWIEHGNFDQASELVTAFMAGEDIPEPSIRIKDIHYGPKSS